MGKVWPAGDARGLWWRARSRGGHKKCFEISYSVVVFWLMAGQPSCRYDRLLLGEHLGKDIFSPLSELESFVGIQDQRLYECLRLLATRFPDGFEG